MCEYFGYEVLKLERVRIMNVPLKGLELGDWRDLTPREMESIYALLEDSTSEVAPKANPQNHKPKTKPKPNTPPRNPAGKKPGSKKPTDARFGSRSESSRGGKPGGKSTGNNPDNRSRTTGSAARKTGGRKGST